MEIKINSWSLHLLIMTTNIVAFKPNSIDKFKFKGLGIAKEVSWYADIKMIMILGNFDIVEFYKVTQSMWKDIKTYYIAWEHNENTDDEPNNDISAIILLDKGFTTDYLNPIFNKFGYNQYLLGCDIGLLKRNWDHIVSWFKKSHEVVKKRDGWVFVNAWWSRKEIYNLVVNNPRKSLEDILYGIQNPY